MVQWECPEVNGIVPLWIVPLLPAEAIPGALRDGTLLVSGLRLTAGKAGPERAGATFKPGGSVALHFDVRGLATAAAGAGRMRITYELPDRRAHA